MKENVPTVAAPLYRVLDVVGVQEALREVWVLHIGAVLPHRPGAGRQDEDAADAETESKYSMSWEIVGNSGLVLPGGAISRSLTGFGGALRGREAGSVPSPHPVP